MNLNQSDFHLDIAFSGLYAGGYISEMISMMAPDVQYRSANEKVDYLILNHLPSIDWSNAQIVDQLIEMMNLASQTVIYNGDECSRIKSSIAVRKKVKANRLSFGFLQRCDVQAINVTICQDAISMDVLCHGELFGHYHLPNYGRSFIYNDLCCIAIGYCEGMDSEEIQKILETYKCDKKIKTIEMMKYTIQSIGNLDELISVLKDLQENYPYIPVYLVNNQEGFPIDLKKIKFQVLRSYIARYYDLENMKIHLEELKQENCLLLILSDEQINIE